MPEMKSPMAILLLRGYEETKEEIWDSLPELEHHEENLDAYLRSLGPVYAARDELRARIAELRGPAALPKRARDRSAKQERVARCPRCSGSEIQA
jgi:hypothetical protein